MSTSVVVEEMPYSFLSNLLTPFYSFLAVFWIVAIPCDKPASMCVKWSMLHGDLLRQLFGCD